MYFHPNSIIPEAARARVVTEFHGERLFAPELSEYVDERRVRHLWQCESCGYAFETTISFYRDCGLGVASTSARRPFSEISQVALKDFLCAFENR